MLCLLKVYHHRKTCDWLLKCTIEWKVGPLLDKWMNTWVYLFLCIWLGRWVSYHCCLSLPAAALSVGHRFPPGPLHSASLPPHRNLAAKSAPLANFCCHLSSCRHFPSTVSIHLEAGCGGCLIITQTKWWACVKLHVSLLFLIPPSLLGPMSSESYKLEPSLARPASSRCRPKSE